MTRTLISSSENVQHLDSYVIVEEIDNKNMLHHVQTPKMNYSSRLGTLLFLQKDTNILEVVFGYARLPG